MNKPSQTSICSKLPDVGTSIFSVMSKMALEHNAINLSQGFPDFDVPAELIERLHFHMTEGKNQYPPMQGVEALRQAIALKLQNSYGVKVDPDLEITITSGATEALFVAIQALVNPEDEVIVFDPAYDSYEPAIKLAGGKTIHIPLTGDDFSIDWSRVADAITAKTRAIVVNSPHNPTGAILGQKDLDALSELVTRNGLYVISDEVYEHMVYDGQAHLTLLAHPTLRERCFVVSSFGKTYHATGWKVGYTVAPPSLTAEFRKIHQFVNFTTHTPTQWAIADFLSAHPEHHENLPQFYQAKRDLFLDAIKDLGFQTTPSRGTYFQLANYSALSKEADVDFAQRLTTEIGVAVIPISVFYESPPENHFVRFCFAKSDSTLLEAANKLKSGLI